MYPLSSAQIDDIIKKAAYHRHEFCRSVVWFPPYKHDGVRLSLATPFQRTFSEQGVGALGRLPLELLYDVFGMLDMRSLLRFRQANLRARQLLDSFSPYGAVVAHGLTLLRALFRTGLAPHVCLSDFFDVLCRRSCDFCPRFGGFVSLLAWRRCCFKCLHSEPAVEVQTLASAWRSLDLDRSHLPRLKTLKTLPGWYAMMEDKDNAIMVLVSSVEAERVAGRERKPDPQSNFNAGTRNVRLSFMASCALPHYDRETRRVEHGLSCAGCVARVRFGGATREDRLRSRLHIKVYDRAGFMNHFRRCEKAQRYWAAPDEERGRTPELPPIPSDGTRLSPGPAARILSGRSYY